MPLVTRPGILGASVRFWKKSYAADYITIVVLAVCVLLMHLFLRPFHRMFYIDNLAIQYPYTRQERVPEIWSIIYSGVSPLILIFVWGLVARFDVHKLHVSILGLLSALAMTPFITGIIKNSVGRPRPDLIARCQPEEGTPEHTLVTYAVCTQPNERILREGWRSFPSGHSSFGFAGLGYLALFISGQLHVFRPRADLASCFLALLPLLGAVLIAISRCEDYRHDVWDVTSGAVLGSVVTYFSYRRFYPSLRSARCDIPYKADDVINEFRRVSSDEESQNYWSRRDRRRRHSISSDVDGESVAGSLHLNDVQADPPRRTLPLH